MRHAVPAVLLCLVGSIALAASESLPVRLDDYTAGADEQSRFLASCAALQCVLFLSTATETILSQDQQDALLNQFRSGHFDFRLTSSIFEAAGQDWAEIRENAGDSGNLPFWALALIQGKQYMIDLDQRYYTEALDGLETDTAELVRASVDAYLTVPTK